MSRQPRFIRIIRVGKRYIERNGLSLGDALNVALFALTILSLAIAMAGVAIAWITYQDAKMGGEKQEKALKDASESLRSAKSALDESKTTLTDIDANMRGSLGVARKQQGNLSASVALSMKELAAMTQQTEILSRTPDVRMSVECYGDERKGETAKLALIPANDKDYPQYLVLQRKAVTITKLPDLMCEIQLTNAGHAPLTGAFAKVNVFPFGLDVYQAIQYKVVDGADVPFGFLYPPPLRPKDLVNETGFNEPLDLLKVNTIYPTSTNDIVRILLYVRVPEKAREVETEWRYGGNEMKTVVASAIITLKKSAVSK